MFCRRCRGRVCVDRTFTGNRLVELSCLMCGKRIFVNPDENVFGAWIDKREKTMRLLTLT